MSKSFLHEHVQILFRNVNLISSPIVIVISRATFFCSHNFTRQESLQCLAINFMTNIYSKCLGMIVEKDERENILIEMLKKNSRRMKNSFPSKRSIWNFVTENHFSEKLQIFLILKKIKFKFHFCLISFTNLFSYFNFQLFPSENFRQWIFSRLSRNLKTISNIQLWICNFTHHCLCLSDKELEDSPAPSCFFDNFIHNRFRYN